MKIRLSILETFQALCLLVLGMSLIVLVRNQNAQYEALERKLLQHLENHFKAHHKHSSVVEVIPSSKGLEAEDVDINFPVYGTVR